MRRVVAARRESVYTPAILLLAGIVGISFLGLGFVMPLRALYGKQLGATSEEIGLMASAALLTGFLFAPAVGWLTDRFGHRNVLWIGLLAHGALVLAYVPVQSPVALIGLRALEGIAIVGVLPPARALMNTIAPVSRQAEATGLLSSAQMVGILLGPAVGTVLASQVGYTPSFLIAAIPLFAGALVARLFLPAHAHQHVSHVAEDVTALRGGLFTPPLKLVYVLSAVLSLTNGTIAAIWSLYMLDRGASLPVIGLSYTTYAIPTAFLTPLAGRVSDRRGRFWPLFGGLLLYTVVYVFFSLPISPLWLVIISGIEGIAAAAARSALDGLLADVMPAGSRGKAQANYSAAGTAGSFVGATTAGFLYAISPGAPFFAAAVLFLTTAIALLAPGPARLFSAGRPAAASVAPEATSEITV
jgi:DHA1 family multidrug resistance protein-like MFS transporter